MIKNICKNCTGCRLCESICPQNAIYMEEDKEGFIIAKIDYNRCINCNLCTNKCPQNVKYQNNDYYGKAYAVQINDIETLSNSTSGGFFSALAKIIFENDGIIFGATINQDLYVYHKWIDNINELDVLRGSKYVVSDTMETFKEAQKFLEDGRYVMYVGVPCQIAALNSFLQKQYKNLLTVDLICHGTPNYKLFDIYRKGTEKKLNSKILKYKFRDKSKNGWGVYWSYYYKDGNKMKNGGLNDDPYISTFINGTANKEACYNCKYTGFTNRPADITLGDFWGVDIFHPEMASNEGVSAVIVNTYKAEDIVNKALTFCKYVETKKENIAKYNKCLVTTIERPPERDYIYEGIDELEPLKFINKKLRIPLKLYLKTKIRLILPYEIRIKIKKILNKERK